MSHEPEKVIVIIIVVLVWLMIMLSFNALLGYV